MCVSLHKNIVDRNALYAEKGIFWSIAGRCETFSIDIEEIGTYEIKLKAENAVSMVEDSYVQYVQTPIEGRLILYKFEDVIKAIQPNL